MLGSHLRILQANLNRSPNATESTLQLAIELSTDIIVVQEPCLVGHSASSTDFSNARSTSHPSFIQILPSLPSPSPNTNFLTLGYPRNTTIYCTHCAPHTLTSRSICFSASQNSAQLREVLGSNGSNVTAKFARPQPGPISGSKPRLADPGEPWPLKEAAKEPPTGFPNCLPQYRWRSP